MAGVGAGLKGRAMRGKSKSDAENREIVLAEIREKERQLLELRRERKGLAAVAEQQAHILEGVRREEDTRHFEGRPYWWGNRGGPSLRALAEEVITAKRENMKIKARYLRTLRSLRERERLLKEITAQQAGPSQEQQGIFTDAPPPAKEYLAQSSSSRSLLRHVMSQACGPSAGVTAEQILRFKDHADMLSEGRILDARRYGEEFASNERNLQDWKDRVAEARGQIAEREQEHRENIHILRLLRSACDGRFEHGKQEFDQGLIIRGGVLPGLEADGNVGGGGGCLSPHDSFLGVANGQQLCAGMEPDGELVDLAVPEREESSKRSKVSVSQGVPAVRKGAGPHPKPARAAEKPSESAQYLTDMYDPENLPPAEASPVRGGISGFGKLPYSARGSGEGNIYSKGGGRKNLPEAVGRLPALTAR